MRVAASCIDPHDNNIMVIASKSSQCFYELNVFYVYNRYCILLNGDLSWD